MVAFPLLRAVQLHNCAIRGNIKTFLHWTTYNWTTLVARIAFTHEAIRALASQEDAGALYALAEAAAVEDQFIRRTAMEVIGLHPQGRDLRIIVLRALRDPSEWVVRTACDVVARWKFNEAHERVVALLADPSKITRQTAIQTLG